MHSRRRWTGARLARAIVGILVFGALMAVRTEVQDPAARALVAALGGACLAFSLVDALF